MKTHRSPYENNKNHENHGIHTRIMQTKKNHRSSCENHENHENPTANP